MINEIFQNFFSVVPYEIFEGIAGMIVVFEFFYTFFENWDRI